MMCLLRDHIVLFGKESKFEVDGGPSVYFVLEGLQSLVLVGIFFFSINW